MGREGLFFVAAMAIVSTVITGWAIRRRQRAAVREAAAGLAPTVDIAIRRLGTDHAWRGRWRHGMATISAQELRWRPQRFRPGPPIRLTNVHRLGEPREIVGHETIWLAPELLIYRVVSTDAPDVQYELAVFPNSDRYLNQLPQRRPR